MLVVVPTLTLLSQMAGFHKSWYKPFAIRGHPYCNTFTSPAVSYSMDGIQKLGFLANLRY